MHGSTRTYSCRSRRRLLTEDDLLESSSSSSSSPRPGSKRSSCSRLSTDSGAGSFDDPTPDRRMSCTPDFWIERRHTAPVRKLLPFEEGALDPPRPNTVWGGCSPRCSLSKYAPLPAIGGGRRVEPKPVPVRRRCFAGPLDFDEDSEGEPATESVVSSLDLDEDSDNKSYRFKRTARESVLSSSDIDEDSDNKSYSFKRPVRESVVSSLDLNEDSDNKPYRFKRTARVLSSSDIDDDKSTGGFERPVPRQCFMEDEEEVDQAVRPMFALTLEDSDDSDFLDEEPEQVGEEEDEECENEEPRRSSTLIRSATFTIEKERPPSFVTVAVRLPDSTRVEERFECRETLGSVCETALDKAAEGASRPRRYVAITNEVPRRTFRDMTMSLKEAGIDDKTLLYLQTLDDAESE